MAAAGLGFSSIPLSRGAPACRLGAVTGEQAGGATGGRRPDPAVPGPDLPLLSFDSTPSPAYPPRSGANSHGWPGTSCLTMADCGDRSGRNHACVASHTHPLPALGGRIRVGRKLAAPVGADLQRQRPDLGLAMQWSRARSLAAGKPTAGQRPTLLHSRFAGASSSAVRTVWLRACRRRGCVFVGGVPVRASHHYGRVQERLRTVWQRPSHAGSCAPPTIAGESGNGSARCGGGRQPSSV
jgi:hypothetical protein